MVASKRVQGQPKTTTPGAALQPARLSFDHKLSFKDTSKRRRLSLGLTLSIDSLERLSLKDNSNSEQSTNDDSENQSKGKPISPSLLVRRRRNANASLKIIAPPLVEATPQNLSDSNRNITACTPLVRTNHNRGFTLSSPRNICIGACEMDISPEQVQQENFLDVFPSWGAGSGVSGFSVQVTS